MKNSAVAKYSLVALLVILAALSRLLPHPPNFTPIAAIALFGAALPTNKWISLFIALSAMLLSDYVLGFHSGMYFVYGSFAIIFILGLISNTSKIRSLIGTSLTASILFFVITNFGVWVGSGMYSMDWTGFVQCYTMALPFFGNTIMGDLLYVGVLFGIYHAIKTYLPAYALKPVAIEVK